MRRVLRRLEWIHVVGFALVGIMLLTPSFAEASQPCCNTGGCACSVTGSEHLLKLLHSVLQQSILACDCILATEDTTDSCPLVLPFESGHLKVVHASEAMRWVQADDESVHWFEDGICPENGSIQPGVPGIRAPPECWGNVLCYMDFPIVN